MNSGLHVESNRQVNDHLQVDSDLQVDSLPRWTVTSEWTVTAEWTVTSGARQEPEEAAPRTEEHLTKDSSLPVLSLAVCVCSGHAVGGSRPGVHRICIAPLTASVAVTPTNICRRRGSG